MSEYNENFDNAVIKIEHAISNIATDIDSTKKANMLDTKSQVICNLGRHKEALQIVEKSLELLPDSKCLKKKKTKNEQAI